MKKVNQYLLLCTFIIVPIQLFSQVRFFEIEDLIDNVRIKKVIDGMDAGRYINITGSQYLFDNFTEGVVTLVSGKKYKGQFQYDIYSDEVLFQVKNITYVMSFPDDIEVIEIDGVKLVYSEYQAERNLKKSYFQCLAQGTCQLLVKQDVIFSDAVAAKPYVDAKPASFKHGAKTYYLKKLDQPAVEISKKSSVIAFFDEEGFDISEFLKKEKINLNNEEDLLKLVAHANDLIRIENVIE